MMTRPISATIAPIGPVIRVSMNTMSPQPPPSPGVLVIIPIVEPMMAGAEPRAKAVMVRIAPNFA